MYSDRVLLTVHGVNSENEGLARLREACEKKLPGLICDSHYYSRVAPPFVLSKGVQNFIYRNVFDTIELTWHRHVSGSNRKMFIVAHSLGTLAVLRAFQMHVPHVTIDGLILLGSIIPRSTEWDGFIRSGQLRYPPLAVIRPADRIVRLSTLRVQGEPSGASGFIANGQYRVRETFKNGGHSAYFPDDVEDVVTAIRDGINSVPIVSREEYNNSCSWAKRFRLRYLP